MFWNWKYSLTNDGALSWNSTFAAERPFDEGGGQIKEDVLSFWKATAQRGHRRAWETGREARWPLRNLRGSFRGEQGTPAYIRLGGSTTLKHPG